MKPRLIFMFFIILPGCKENDSSEQFQAMNNKEIIAEHYLQEIHDSGLDFKHNNLMQGDYWPHEILGAGGAVIDVDSDGDLDLYLRQSSDDSSVDGDRLFLNQWQEKQAIQFLDGSVTYGIGSFGYGMGVTLADIDNDGDSDLFLSNFGHDVMLENRNSQFVRIPGPWETNDWSTSATFLDFNRDGWMDLYVGRYNQYQQGQDYKCFNNKSQIDYCSPKTYPLSKDALYMNQNGQFIDVSDAAQITSEAGYTLGVVVEDFNQDGWPDVLTANDATQNFLWINQKNDTFINEGLVRGIAVNGKGRMEASMGIGMTDYDKDLDWDFIMTHLATESNTLYVNNGQSYYIDLSNVSKMAELSKPYTAFGVGWLDVNNDQLEDLIVVNGAVNTIAKLRQSGDSLPLKQKQQVLLHQPDHSFKELVDQTFPFINEPKVGRSAIFADFDNDGDQDFVVTVNNDQPIFIENTSPTINWVGLDLANKSGSQALGASVLAIFKDGEQQLKRYHNDGSYLSGNDPRIIIKWTGPNSLDKAVISWHDGSESVHSDFMTNRYQTVTQP